MTDATRVALLARPGASAERLRAALDAAGAQLVLEADPTAIEAAALTTAAPQAVVVVLDAAVEDVLDRFDAVLSDPAIDVLYEESDLAATREGWDAARWTRHLSAKLLHHGDVLPPGREPDHAPAPAARSAPEPPPSERIELPVAPSLAPATATIFDPVVAEYDPAATSDAATDLSFDTASFEIDGSFEADLSEPDDEPIDSIISSDGGTGDEPALETPEPDAFESLSLEEAPAPTVQAPDGHDPPPLALALDDTAPAPVAAAASSHDAIKHFRRDLVDIERRIAAMELVPDEKAPKPASQAHGAVLVLAGIGGPDAVRQFLGELPDDFPRPVLIHQRLDGGRYDRLVQQMARATRLPVRLAADGDMAVPGHVYILPPDLGLASSGSGLHFVGDGSDPIAALPPSDSAVLMFSGSDTSLVDAAMRQAEAGALVAGQSPEDCYDAAAADALVARGAQSGQPAELARRLAERWVA